MYIALLSTGRGETEGETVCGKQREILVHGPCAGQVSISSGAASNPAVKHSEVKATCHLEA